MITHIDDGSREEGYRTRHTVQRGMFSRCFLALLCTIRKTIADDNGVFEHNTALLALKSDSVLDFNQADVRRRTFVLYGSQNMTLMATDVIMCCKMFIQNQMLPDGEYFRTEKQRAYYKSMLHRLGITYIRRGTFRRGEYKKIQQIAISWPEVVYALISTGSLSMSGFISGWRNVNIPVINYRCRSLVSKVVSRCFDVKEVSMICVFMPLIFDQINQAKTLAEFDAKFVMEDGGFYHEDVTDLPAEISNNHFLARMITAVSLAMGKSPAITIVDNLSTIFEL